jgi:WD40 repeat protein
MNATASSNGVHQDRGFGHHRGPVTCAAGIPGTRLVITSAYDSAVGLFDLDSGTVDLLGYHEHLANRIVVNAAGSLAASSSSDYTIRLWDSEHRRLERVLLGHSDDVEDFAFVDETTGVSVARDWRILVWDLATGAVTRGAGGTREGRPVGRELWRQTLHIGRRHDAAADGRMRHSVSLGRRSPKSMCFLDERTVIVGDYWGALIKFDLETEKVTRRTVARNGISSVCSQGNDVVASSYDGALYLVDPVGLGVVRVLRAMVQRVPVKELNHS